VQITWDEDGAVGPLLPVNYETGFACENESDLQIIGTGLDDFELAEGQITVEEDMTTIVVNIFSSLDVYVRDDETDLPIEFAEVCLYDDSAMTVLIECVETDADGMARFFFAGNVFEDTTFTSSASAEGYEDESFTFEYSLFTDLEDGGGLVDDALTADVIQSLDPDIAPVP
jgi:hypothetical protein